MSSTPYLTIENLAVEFAGQRVLCGVSFSLAKGERRLLVGRNGSGKSTLLRAILGLVPRSSGRVIFDGQDLATLNPRQRAKLVAYVPQGFLPPFPVTVGELLLMSRYAHRPRLAGYSKLDQERIEWALEITDTARFRERGLLTLSGGERQRVYIASSLAQEAKILLLDEPFTGLDLKYQVELTALLDHLAQECELTYLAALHDLNLGALLGQSVLALKCGEVVYDGEFREFMQQQLLESVFGGGFRLIPHDQTGDPVVVPDLIGY